MRTKLILILALALSSTLLHADTEWLTKEYRIPPGILANGMATDNHPVAAFRRPTAKEYLMKRGVQFPPGAAAVYMSNGNRLVVKNTKEQMLRIDDIVKAMR